MSEQNDERWIGVVRALRSRNLYDDAVQCAHEYQVTIAELLGTGRTKRVSTARIAFWRTLHLRGFSYPEIGALFERHFSTVLLGIKRATENGRLGKVS